MFVHFTAFKLARKTIRKPFKGSNDKQNESKKTGANLISSNVQVTCKLISPDLCE
jgi:hypothetical protein